MNAFAALAEPTRLHIVELLARKGRLPASEISKQFKASPPAISQHLKVLKEANLVHAEVKGQQRIYSLNQKGITDIEQWISKLRKQWEQRFNNLEQLLIDELNEE
jgi:DNA-binding transcriptional ArsR family regulator